MAAGVRVNWTRLVLSTLRNEDGAAHRRVMASIRSRDALEQAGRIAWIPLSVHMEVCEAIHNLLGDPAFREHFCRSTLASGRGPLFGPLVQGFLRLFGPTPASTVRAAPQAWSFIFRDLGRLRTDRVESKAVTATISDLHPSLRGRDTFITGVLGAFDATLRFVEFDGTVEMDAAELGKGRAHYEIRWA